MSIRVSIKISEVGRKSEQEKDAEYWTAFTGPRKVVRRLPSLSAEQT